MITNTADREPAWSVERALLASGAYVSRAGIEGARACLFSLRDFVKRH